MTPSKSSLTSPASGQERYLSFRMLLSEGQQEAELKRMEHRVWQPPMSQSERDVNYSCGACGFSLNLCSSDRLITANNGAKLLTARRKKRMAFVSIDDSRFQLEEAVTCWVHTLRGPRTRFLCRKCGACIGYVRESPASPSSPSGKRYYVNIRAIHPEQESAFTL